MGTPETAAILKDIAELRKEVRSVLEALNGSNSTPGLLTRIRMLEAWQASVSKLLWIVCGVLVAEVMGALFLGAWWLIMVVMKVGVV